MKRALLPALCAVVTIGWMAATVPPSGAVGGATAAPVARPASDLVPARPGPLHLDTAAAVEVRPERPSAAAASTPTTRTEPAATTTTTVRHPPTRTLPSATRTTTDRTTTATRTTATRSTASRSTTTTTRRATSPTAAPPTTSAPSGWGCGPAIAYLRTHAAPGFTFECPGSSLGHQAMTCIDVPGVCPGEKLIAITVPCPAAYMNEASNSYALQHLSDAPIDPYGYCH